MHPKVPSFQLHPLILLLASKFRQQELPAFRPMLNPSKVIALYLVVCAVLISLGCLCLDASNNVMHSSLLFLTSTQVTQIKYRYDDDSDCFPNNVSNSENTKSQLMQEDGTKKCTLRPIVNHTMKPPIYVYYELTDYFQNHRRYVKSRSDHQLAGKSTKAVADCKPKDKLDMESGDSATEGSRDINPCGLAAWSYFNDTFEIIRDREGKNLLNDKGIAWKTDIEYKFANYNATNFNEGPERGGGEINGNVSADEHFIVWMRVAALSSRFRKLYGTINEKLDKNTILDITIDNNYNTYGFGGHKSIVLSTTSWLGGHDDFLGVLQITLGCACFFAGICYSILHIKFPRKPGDERFLSWTR